MNSVVSEVNGKRHQHKFALGSPAYFVGESVGRDIRLRHAWGNIFNYGLGVTEINSKSYHILEFEFEDEPLRVGRPVPNYYGVGEVVSYVLSVVFGKLFIPMGFMATRDSYCVPDIPSFEAFQKRYPFFSNEIRPEFPIALDRSVIGEIRIEAIKSSTLRAANLYQVALSEFGRAPDVAYINLVTAGEIITADLEFSAEELYDSRTLDLFERLRSLGTDGQEAYGLLRGKLKQLKRKYILGLKMLADERIFFGAEFGSLSKTNLKDALGASYDLRSKYLHEGVRIANHVVNGPYEVGLTYNSGHSKEVQKVLQKAPSFISLERVIRMAILKNIFIDMEAEFSVPTSESALILK